MLTPLTQTALAVLNDISCGEISPRSTQYAFFSHDLETLLLKLESAGLIHLTADKCRKDIFSFTLPRPRGEISLLDVLEATGEHLNCNQEANEELYRHYGQAAQKLGVVNHMTRLYLSEIKLVDL